MKPPLKIAYHLRQPFKKCTTCGTQWHTRDQWLTDPDLKLVGYQVNFKGLKTGVLMFNHSCRTTLALYAEDFADLYNGPIFKERATGSEKCPGHCLHRGDLEPCPAICECNYIRHIIQLIKDWPKKEPETAQPIKCEMHARSE